MEGSVEQGEKANSYFRQGDDGKVSLILFHGFNIQLPSPLRLLEFPYIQIPENYKRLARSTVIRLLHVTIGTTVHKVFLIDSLGVIVYSNPMNGYDNWKLSSPETSYRDEDNERTITLQYTDAEGDERKDFEMLLDRYDAQQFDDCDLSTLYILEYLADELDAAGWLDDHTAKIEVIW